MFVFTGNQTIPGLLGCRHSSIHSLEAMPLLSTLTALASAPRWRGSWRPPAGPAASAAACLPQPPAGPPRGTKLIQLEVCLAWTHIWFWVKNNPRKWAHYGLRCAVLWWFNLTHTHIWLWGQYFNKWTKFVWFLDLYVYPKKE